MDKDQLLVIPLCICVLKTPGGGHRPHPTHPAAQPAHPAWEGARAGEGEGETEGERYEERVANINC